MKRKIIFAAAFMATSVGAQEVGEVANSEIARKEYSKCVAVTSWLFQGRNADEIDGSDKVVQIPKGWEVIGTGSVHDQPVFYICKP